MQVQEVFHRNSRTIFKVNSGAMVMSLETSLCKIGKVKCFSFNNKLTLYKKLFNISDCVKFL